MRLTLQTDYTMRVLLFLGSRPGEVIPASTIADAYGVSRHHIAKIAKTLVRDGLVRARRGHSGGLELALPPAEIRVGAVVRSTEPDLVLLECMDPTTNTCPLHGVCRLERVLHDARAAFLATLDAYTLEDLLHNAPQLMRVLARGPSGRRPPRQAAPGASAR